MNPFSKHDAFFVVISVLLTFSPLAAAERVPMPLGALVCKALDPTIEHARLVRQPSTAGLRALVEAQVESGACRVIKSERRRSA